MGLVGYYRRFVKDFFRISALMNRLTRKKKENSNGMRSMRMILGVEEKIDHYSHINYPD